MSPEEFQQNLKAKATQVSTYVQTRFASTAGNVALRFINGNFRAGGYQGKTFKKWKPSQGTTLVKSGALRAANYYTTQPGQATLKNNMPYANVHNEGFKGDVAIKAHSRNSYGKKKVGTGKLTKSGKERKQTVTFKTGEKAIRSHTRKINMPQRQFMPINAGDSPVLNNAVTRAVTNDIKAILNQ
ncbi:hypothetical protein [Flavobacterium sp.]|uniref:hypothetical protein n=1 Tax=Flavobacterium sp. TaxID=239 RepID=UPI0025F803A9|nr:hypothetical protein [Flavobacterium sp.]